MQISRAAKHRANIASIKNYSTCCAPIKVGVTEDDDEVLVRLLVDDALDGVLRRLQRVITADAELRMRVQGLHTENTRHYTGNPMRVHQGLQIREKYSTLEKSALKSCRTTLNQIDNH